MDHELTNLLAATLKVPSHFHGNHYYMMHTKITPASLTENSPGRRHSVK